MIITVNFFSSIRQSLFGGHLTESQVNGITAVFDYWETLGNSDIRQLACILGNIYHETGKTMQPVKERGGDAYLKNKHYWPYYGRDLLQTTWIANYRKVRDFSGIDVVNNPELIGQMPLAAKVAVEFMIHGWYTGKKLSDFFNEFSSDWLHSRKIINGLDRAIDVAEYDMQFHAALI